MTSTNYFGLASEASSIQSQYQFRCLKNITEVHNLKFCRQNCQVQILNFNSNFVNPLIFEFEMSVKFSFTLNHSSNRFSWKKLCQFKNWRHLWMKPSLNLRAFLISLFSYFYISQFVVVPSLNLENHFFFFLRNEKYSNNSTRLFLFSYYIITFAFRISF